ncbi:hypothetical protein QAD02_020096 [Eretmocerus hayati]|uniref:Uncharacterized protein n=1 Tax=Eretmocerus hayati TaxID=131215 RepID=A0ACC2PNZ3_9HYME|nr:hypothetical protein QAD02_020096 [Eretmocerus hayati]
MREKKIRDNDTRGERIIIEFTVFPFHKSTLTEERPYPKVTDECLAEYGIDRDLIYNRDESRPSALTDEQLYCVAACVYREMGIMRPNGTIDGNKAETFFGKDDSSEREIFFAVYNACNEGRVGCKLVQCMFKELKNHWSSTHDSDMIIGRTIFPKETLVERL